MIGQYIRQCGGPILNDRCGQCGGVAVSSSAVCDRYVPQEVRGGGKTIAVWSAEEIDRLRAENAELRKDRERLDFVESRRCMVEPWIGDTEWSVTRPHHVNEVALSVRVAIDAAMQAEEGESA